MDSLRRVRKHESLQVWSDSMDLVERVYELTNCFPNAEKFGLCIQMRRASVSVPSNIAEGAARDSLKEYIRFLVVARGSLTELETQLQIAKRLNYIESYEICMALADRVFAKLSALIKSLKHKSMQQNGRLSSAVSRLTE